MSIDSSVFDAIGDLFNGRVSPGTAPFSTPRPYACYRQVGGRAINYTDATRPGLRNARIQIDIWHDTPDEARALAETVEDRMRARLRAAVLGALISDDYPDLQCYGTKQDFSVWYA